jgi:hypothetical protein
VIDSSSLDASVPAEVVSESHQPIVFETGVPNGSGGGSTVSDVAADSADGCLIRVYSESGVDKPRLSHLQR